MNVKIKKDLIILGIIFFISTILMLIFFPNPDFDFYNYQLYNGWAFLNNRIGIDFMPVGFRTYWTPYLDTFQYLMAVKLNNHKFIYAILMHLDNVLALFLVYKISDKIISNKFENKYLYISLIILYAIFSPVITDILDSSRNEMFLADFVLLAFYIFLNMLDKNSKLELKTAIIGTIIGFITALKLTSITYAITFFICLILLHKNFNNPFKLILIYSGCAILSFLLIDGYWLYTIYEKFKNPFFPVFNEIFHSPYADFQNIYDKDYSYIKAENLYQFIFYPFLHSFNHSYGFSKKLWDPRYAINIICIFIIFICILKNFTKNLNINIKDKYLTQIKFLIIFFFFSYELNVLLFGIYRYIIATSILYGLVLFYALFLIFKNKHYRLYSYIFIILFCLLNQNSGKNEKFLIFNKSNILNNEQNYNLEDNSYVFIFGVSPSNFIINQNKNVKFISFVFPKHFIRILKSKYPIIEFYSYFYFSDYNEVLIKNILNNKFKKYIYSKDLSANKIIIRASIKYYSNNKITIGNCINQNLCELKRIEHK